MMSDPGRAVSREMAVSVDELIEAEPLGSLPTQTDDDTPWVGGWCWLRLRRVGTAATVEVGDQSSEVPVIYAPDWNQRVWTGTLASP